MSANGIPPSDMAPRWPAAMAAAAARAHLQRWRSLCWHRVTAAIHGGSLEIRATKPLITLWAYNPPAAPSEWNAISLLQLELSGERGERAAGDTGDGQEVVVSLLSCSPCHLHSVTEGGRVEGWELNLTELKFSKAIIMSLNMNHGRAKETTFTFKLSGVQHNLIPNEYLGGIQMYPLFLFLFKIRERALCIVSSRKQSFLF